MSETTQKQAIEAIDKIQAAPVSDVVRDATDLEIGQAVHQGDVYVIRVDPAKTAHGAERGSRQVAIGETVGARHFAEGALDVFHPAPGADQFTGPIVKAESPWMLTHPEHADFRMPAGAFQCRYQLDYATQQRVAD